MSDGLQILQWGLIVVASFCAGSLAADVAMFLAVKRDGRRR